MAIQTTTALQGTLDTRGTQITISPIRGLIQVVLSDSGAGGNAAVWQINGNTANGSIPASGIATPIVVPGGVSSITLYPSSNAVNYWITPIVFAGGN